MKRIALAALLATGLAAGAAQAQAPSVGGGGTVVGGGFAAMLGGGDDMRIEYAGGGGGGGGAVLRTQAPRLARAQNGYGNPGVEYLEPERAAAGREAWMVGGGDNAEVVYVRR